MGVSSNPLWRTTNALGIPHVNIGNLTVQSLKLTATQGSTLLSFEWVRLREVRRMVLLIEPDKTPSYCHSLFSSTAMEEESSVYITTTRGLD